MSGDVSRKIGRYEIQDRIGQGGMGVLYLARDPAIDRLVAIKVLRTDFEDEDARARFAGEARAAGRLRHPNIVTIHDVGEDDGRPYIAMEYIPGETLHELIRRRAPLSTARRLHLIEDICRGLAYAHKAGLIHRDVKPANIMVDPEGVVKILDFGIARAAATGSTMGASILAGTPSYMSPEQVQGDPLDTRSDIFAVGAVFYELLSYQRAFAGDNPQAVIFSIIHKQPEPLRSLCPGLNVRIEEIVYRALEKAPADRYQDLSLMRADIERIREQVLTPGEQLTSIGVAVPRPVADPAPRALDPRIDERRANKIEQHVKEAIAAIDAGRAEDALEAAEEALMLKADEARALDLIDRARRALDARRLAGHVEGGRQSLRAGDLTAAEVALMEALAIDATSTEAAAFQREVQQARREQARIRERRKLGEEALHRARESFDAGAFESAVRAASEALSHDSTLRPASDLRERARAAIEEQRQAAVARQAAETVERARQLLGDGDEAGASALLEAFTPAVEIVQHALRELRTAQAERAWRRAWATTELATARSDLDQQRVREAIARLTEIRAAEPAAPGLDELWQAASAALAALEAAEARERVRKGHLEAASRYLGEGALEDALARAKDARTLDPQDRDAQDLVATVEARIKVRRDLQDRTRAKGAIDLSRTLAGRGQFAAAIEILQRFEPKLPIVEDALGEILQRKAERDRHREWVAERLAAARTMLERGEARQAIAVLEQVAARAADEPALEPLLQQARSAVAALDESDRRERAIRQHLDAAERHVDRDELAAALARTREALAVDRDHPAARQLASRIEGLIEDRRRADERERERAERAVDDARSLAAASRDEEALRWLREFSPPHPIVSEALATLASEIAARPAPAHETGEPVVAAPATAAIADEITRGVFDTIDRDAPGPSDQVAPPPTATSAASTAPARATPYIDRRLLLIGAAAVLVIAASVAGYLLFGRSRPTAGPEPTSTAAPVAPPTGAAAAPTANRVQAIRDLFARDQPQALSLLAQSLREAPQDVELGALLTETARAARSEALNVQDEVTRLAAKPPSARVKIAAGKLRATEPGERAGPSVDLVQAYWDARDELVLALVDDLIPRDRAAAVSRLQMALQAHPSSSTLATGLATLVDGARQQAERARAAVENDRMAAGQPALQQGLATLGQVKTGERQPSDLATYWTARDYFLLARTQALARGDRNAALSQLNELARNAASSPVLRQGLQALTTEARDEAVRARDQARTRGVPLDARAFRDGERAFDAGETSRQRDDWPDATRHYWEAHQFFDRGVAVARGTAPPVSPPGAPGASAPPTGVTPVTPSVDKPGTVRVGADPPVVSEPPPKVAEIKAAPPVAPKPPAPPPPVVSDDDLVQQTVRGYAQAYTAMDVASATRLWPGVSEEVRKRRFEEYRSQSMTIGAIDVDLLANGTARATVQGSWVMVPRAASRPPSPTRFVFTLQKSDGRWLITGLQPLQ